MGKVTEELIGLIAKQVEDRGIVVWYDPEEAYGEVAAGFSLPETTVLRYSDGFFELRHRIDPFLECVEDSGKLRADAEVPPRLVVYVPKDRLTIQYALVEVEAAGVVMEPGANPWQRNTRLKVLAERVFKGISPDRAPEIAQKVDQGLISLAELDQLADQTGELGTVKLIFTTTSAREVAMMFGSSEERDAAIEEKKALTELADLFRADLGIEIDPEGTVAEARRTFCRALLLGELAARCAAAGSEVSEFDSAAIPRSKRHQQEVSELCATWRNRADLRDAYVVAAQAVEEEASIAGLELAPESLLEVETFPSIESRLLEHAEKQLMAGTAAGALKLAQRRKQSFWATVVLTNQLRWSLVETAANVLLAAARVGTELKSTEKVPVALVRAYAEGHPGPSGEASEPWCVLDTYHRHLERQYATFDLDIEGEHNALEKVIAVARQRYTDVANRCAEAMTEALVATNFEVEGVPHQWEVFATHVGPKSRQGKTAFLLADALRYEMARELIEGLGDGYDIKLMPTVAQLPTITEIGMSVVLPGADKGIELVTAGPGKVAIKIGEVVLKDRAKRVAHLQSAVSGEFLELKLNHLMKPSKKRRAEIEAADFILVTSQEIDRRGEEVEDEEEARRYMDEVLDKIRRGIRTLAKLGVGQFIIVADHGHLFGEVVDSGMKIDPPGGNTADLHRRVWIGQGGAAGDAFVRVPASQLGLGGNLELAFPRGLGCFKKPGASGAFFHGGTSLQEMVIPVAVLKVTEEAEPEFGVPSVELTMDKPKITNRLFSVVVNYAGGTLFAVAEKRVQVSVRSGRQEIGSAATAAYGFEDGTKEILLQLGKPNAITVMLTGQTDVKSASIHVVDAASQVELASMKSVAVDIGM